MKIKNAYLLFLIVLSVGIHIFSKNESLVETRYSNSIYPFLSVNLRSISGFVSFSIGDVFYFLLAVLLILFLVKLIKSLFLFSKQRHELKKNIWRTSFIILFIYIIFNFFWGINYNRQGIAAQLELKSDQYDSVQLLKINHLLLEKVNAIKDTLIRNPASVNDNVMLFSIAEEAYRAAALKYGFMNYENPSVKPSLWGWLGNYVGFTGYYNPFTGEAQINNTVPVFLRPFITCHEIAHQLGYAKENEANFVAYLAAKNSNNNSLKYSAYLELFMYANRTLFILDSSSSMRLRNKLSNSVKRDLMQWKTFIKSHENIVEPVISKLYGFFLEKNRQPMGIMTYDEVIGLLINYYEKTGEL